MVNQGRNFSQREVIRPKLRWITQPRLTIQKIFDIRPLFGSNSWSISGPILDSRLSRLPICNLIFNLIFDSVLNSGWHNSPQSFIFTNRNRLNLEHRVLVLASTANVEWGPQFADTWYDQKMLKNLSRLLVPSSPAVGASRSFAYMAKSESQDKATSNLKVELGYASQTKSA